MPNFLGTGTPPRALPRTAEGRMEHVVFFSESSGDSAFRRVPDLEEAVRLVESLRNERGITDVAVHALTPVPVSFRTYYRVEVAVSQPEPADESVESGSADESAEVAVEVPSVEVPSVEAEWAETESSEAEVEDESVEVESVEVESVSLEEPVVEASALHLLPPPAVEVEQASEDRDEAEVVAAIDALAVTEEGPESTEDSEESERDVSFEAFSLELVREDEAVGFEVSELEAAQFEAAEAEAAQFEAASIEAAEFEVVPSAS